MARVGLGKNIVVEKAAQLANRIRLDDLCHEYALRWRNMEERMTDAAAV